MLPLSAPKDSTGSFPKSPHSCQPQKNPGNLRTSKLVSLVLYVIARDAGPRHDGAIGLDGWLKHLCLGATWLYGFPKHTCSGAPEHETVRM